MPGEVVTLARRHLRQPTNIRAEGLDESAPPPLTTQHVYRTHHMDKIEVLARVLQAKDRGLAMVFCQTKRACDQVATALTDRGFAAATVHGDLGQAQRERALRAFRTGKVDVLVATDVAARGIDVDDVTHVINYECPDDAMAYVHRIGRTGRAGRTGVAITFVDWRDLHRWKLISDALSLGKPDPAETYSNSEHLFTELSIPPDVRGTLPRELRGARAGLAAEVAEDLGETGKTRSQGGGTERGGSERGRSERGGSRSRRRSASGAKASTSADATVASGAIGGDAGEPAAAATRSARRRRRTRGGRELATEATAEAAEETPSAKQAS